MASDKSPAGSISTDSIRDGDLESLLSIGSDKGSPKASKKPSFIYDYDVFNLCERYLKEKNHHGLALIARQKGLPPFLRFKIWPILLKYHPYVLKPSIQPDSRNNDNDKLNDIELNKRIKKDLNKYLIRLKYSMKQPEDKEDSVEAQIFDILQKSICRFMGKWGKIIKYDGALTWIALGLAEWFPPIAKTSWVLVGRDLSSTDNKSIKDLFVDYSNYIEKFPDLKCSLDDLVQDEAISNMAFHEVYERLVLVLLHCPANKLKITKNTSKLTNLPQNGGSIEERVTLFIHIFRKLLPELSDYFSEEQILNKFGSNDDEWLIWWLKYCGSKVWSRLDRGKIWDLLLGFKFKTPGKDYNESLQLSEELLIKLGNDTFWSINDITEDDMNIPFPVIDSHIQLIFVTLALLKSKENTLIELDQHEIRQFLSRLPTNSYSLTNKYHAFKQKMEKLKEKMDNVSLDDNKSNSSGSSDRIISNDSGDSHTIDFMDNIITEAGDLWRKWLYMESE